MHYIDLIEEIMLKEDFRTIVIPKNINNYQEMLNHILTKIKADITVTDPQLRQAVENFESKNKRKLTAPDIEERLNSLIKPMNIRKDFASLFGKSIQMNALRDNFGNYSDFYFKPDPYSK